MFELKIYRGVLRHDSEGWCKIWTRTDSSVQNWHEEFDEFWLLALENNKNLHFNGLLLNKVYNVLAKKSIEELYLMALNIATSFDGKVTCSFKNEMRNLANFHHTTFESLKIGTLMGSIYPKENMCDVKI